MSRVSVVAGSGRLARLAGLLLLALLAPAEARNAYSPDREVDVVRGWHVAANEARRGCLAYATYQSGTVIEVGLDLTKDTAFMLFANKSWRFVETGRRYDVVLTFDGRKRWNGVAVGVQAGEFPGLALEGIKSAFVVDFAAYTSVRLEHRGKRLDGFNLAGTRAAVNATVDCTRDIRDGRLVIDAPRPTPPAPAPADDSRPAAAAEEKKKGPTYSTGTGFFIDDAGHLVTNAHVVEDCDETRLKLPDGSVVEAEIKARSPQNDLAVLAADVKPKGVARLRAGPSIRLGDQIVLFGYPLAGELTVTGNLSTGLVSALAGPGEDVTRMQISAPVQSGNSGGAVVDLTGRVVGVVVAKSDVKSRGAGGGVEVLQNVNFAIKSNVLTLFLDANQTSYASEATGTEKSIADVAAIARDFSALVVCRSK